MRVREALNSKGSLLGLSGLIVSAFAVSALIAAPAQSAPSQSTTMSGMAGAGAAHDGGMDTGATPAAPASTEKSVSAAAVRRGPNLPKVGGPRMPIPKTGAIRPSDGVAKPKMPAGSQETSTTIGPFMVMGGSVGSPGTVPLTATAGGNAPSVNIDKPCTDCYLLGIKAAIIDDSGKQVDLPQKVMLHHIVLGRKGVNLKDLTCDTQVGGATLGERFFASGNELTDIRMPYGYGIYVSNLEVWSSFTHLMNWNPDPKMLSVRLTYSWVPKAMAPKTKSVTPIWLDAAACNPYDTFELPDTGRIQEQAATWTSPVTGKIIGAGGHLHSDGLVLSSVNVSTGKTICNSWSKEFHAPGWTDGHGMDGVSVMSRCYQKDAAHPIATVRRGDTIRTTAYYNRMNDPKDPYQYLMGIMVAFFVPN
jgi:hypothetical protein